jgi:hypothetical protein
MDYISFETNAHDKRIVRGPLKLLNIACRLEFAHNRQLCGVVNLQIVRWAGAYKEFFVF